MIADLTELAEAHLTTKLLCGRARLSWRLIISAPQELRCDEIEHRGDLSRGGDAR